MNKDLNYYMALEYPVEIRKIPEERGGGYMALIPAFGKAAIGDGDTLEEAIQDLHATKHSIFELYLEQGKAIPEPEPLYPTLAPPSGKFVTRMDSILHSRMIHQAERQGVSRNQYAVTAISEKVIMDERAETNRRCGYPFWWNDTEAVPSQRDSLAGTSNYPKAA